MEAKGGNGQIAGFTDMPSRLRTRSWPGSQWVTDKVAKVYCGAVGANLYKTGLKKGKEGIEESIYNSKKP